MAQPTYIVTSATTFFYSDSTIPAEKTIGIDTKFPQNAAYTLYGKPYGQFQRLGEFNLAIDPSIPLQVGQTPDAYGDNIMTNNPANSFSHNRQILGPQPLKVFAGMPAMRILDTGDIECYGSVTDTANNRIYIILSSDHYHTTAITQEQRNVPSWARQKFLTSRIRHTRSQSI